MASLVIGPVDRYPDYARGENQYARILGAQTAVLVAHGGGMVHTLTCGVSGTLAKFYDTPTGGTTDDTNEIATVTLTNADRETVLLDVDFGRGLTVVVTGDANTDITISFRSASIVSERHFGV